MEAVGKKSPEGVSKRGDAIAGIVITLINILGGLFIGVIEDDMPLREAAALFTKLTIGDGLVTQVPAFLISLAAGLLVTRSSREVNLPGEFLRQLFSRPQALAMIDIDKPRIDWVAMGASMGVPSHRVATAEDFHKSLVDSVREDGPVLIEVAL